MNTITRSRTPRLIAALVLTASALLGLAGCSSDKVEVGADTVLIDVRTPAEFATGHLDGAVNIDLEGSSFASEIATLPTDGHYVLYCRSGNRAGQALSYMQQQGFTDVVNAGSVQQASDATGLAVVTK